MTEDKTNRKQWFGEIKETEDEYLYLEAGSKIKLYCKPNTEIKMSFKFEKLIIWRMAMDFGEEINDLANKFPKHEIYNLTSQIRRVADSAALNISEGSISQTNPEQKKFIGYSIRSLEETVTCLHKAKRPKYISEDEFMQNYEFAYNLMNMTVAFQNKIK